jgi:hypothetical protein
LNIFSLRAEILNVKQILRIGLFLLYSRIAAQQSRLPHPPSKKAVAGKKLKAL